MHGQPLANCLIIPPCLGSIIGGGDGGAPSSSVGQMAGNCGHGGSVDVVCKVKTVGKVGGEGEVGANDGGCDGVVLKNVRNVGNVG